MVDIEALKNCIGDLAKNVFFCGANENDQGPTLYARDAHTRSQLTELFNIKKNDEPTFGQIKIESTHSLKLKQTRSLEEILTRVPHQTIYFDPTATIERASVLVCIAKQARQLLGPLLKGCYFNSEKRNIYFLVKAKDKAEMLNLAAVREQLQPIILNATQRLSKPFYYTITISSQKPQGTVVAVDMGSIVKGNMKRLMKGLMNKLKWPFLLASVTSSIGIAAARTGEASLPAVSNVNGWIGAAGDHLHNEAGSGSGGIVEGGIAAPFTHNFGGQLHAYDGAAGGANLFSVDGYVFWRNPAQGLLGPHVIYTKSSEFHHTLYGFHGESYLNSWTLTGEAGGVSRSSNSNTYYGEAIVNWYAQPDWRLYAGGILLGGDGTGQIGTEYQFGLNSLPGLSIFADVGVGAHDLNYGFLGLRYYFGDVCDPCKSLVRRHREDMVPPTLDPIAREEETPSISHM